MNHHNMNSANATKEQQLSKPLESTSGANLKRLDALRGTVINGDICVELNEK